jgi:uncharacterized membrane protein
MEVRLSLVQKIFKLLLGLFLFTAGLAHLTWRRTEFLAQVPPWVPMDADLVVLLSGCVEIGLGLGLLLIPRTRGAVIGVLTALFFIAIFPGNISQYVNGINAFHLDTDRARLIRLFFQPVLVAWALWSSGGWTWLKHKAQARSA